MEIFGYIASLIMGISLGLIGGGGSILTVPILVYFFHYDGVEATTASLLVVGMTAFLGTLLNSKKGLVNYKVVALFFAPSFLGVFLARNWLLPLIPEIIQVPSTSLKITKGSLILIFFSLIMIAASKAMIQNSQINTTESKTDTKIWKILIRAFSVGILTGLIGAGGGFLIIPALYLFLKLPLKIAVGTSLAIITLNSMMAYILSPRSINISLTQILFICFLSGVGLIIGFFGSSLIKENQLKSIFGYFILVIGFFVVIDQLQLLLSHQV